MYVRMLREKNRFEIRPVNETQTRKRRERGRAANSARTRGGPGVWRGVAWRGTCRAEFASRPRSLRLPQRVSVQSTQWYRKPLGFTSMFQNEYLLHCLLKRAYRAGVHIHDNDPAF